MLGDKPRQRHGEVEPQRKLAGSSALVGDLEDLPEHFVGTGSLAVENLDPLDMRRLDRQEAKALEGRSESREHPFPGDHERRRQIPQAAGHAGVDHD